MSITDEELAGIDPGVRHLVALINRLGWETSDSGDGKTKFEQAEPMGCAVAYAHVTVSGHSSGGLLDIGSAELIHNQLGHRLTAAGRERLDVQFSCSTRQGFRFVEVLGINDEDLVP